MSKYCFTCGGQGLVDCVCPECGHAPAGSSSKLPKMDSFSQVKANTETTLVEEGSVEIIQPAYKGVFWNRRILENDNTEKLPEKFDIAGRYNDRLFVRFLDQLTKLDDIFKGGGVPNKSVYVIAPPGYSKTVFAYSCMQYALANGYSVAPLIDTIELKRLLVLASEKLDYKLYSRFTYDDYMTSDVVFVTVTHTYYRYDAYSVLDELINRRARMGLATFIISRYTLKTLYKWDKYNSLDSLKNSNSKDNRKYPSVVAYVEPRNGGN